ncbi:MAG: type I 3-dehydroquinate dehydratase [Haloarculaceae archaeon]
MELSSLERPFICTSLAETTVEETICTLKRAENAGARAFEVHLPLLGFPGEAGLSRIASATRCPVYATCRRGTFYELLGRDAITERDETGRVAELIAAVDAGLDGVDLELDTFAPTGGPDEFSRAAIREYADDESTDVAEVTDDEDAVARQRAAVERVHDRGGDVVLSAHTYTHLEGEDCVAIAERMTDRGADLGKIVGLDRTMDEALETLEAHLRLNEADVLPYALMAIGTTSRVTRPLSPMFGSAWVFAQVELTPGGFHSWPRVEDAREILRRVDWRTAYDPHRE